MADEEKEKAEKLAAAKKRFEQLKKEKEKKGKKSSGKKKEDKAAEAKADDAAEDGAETTTAAEGDAGEETAAVDGDTEPSLPQQSKQRSESFKQSWNARIEELEKENQTLREQSAESAVRLAKAEEELDGLREGSSDLAELRAKAKEAERLGTELASSQRQLTQAQNAAKGARPRSGTTSSPDLTEQLASKMSAIESLELEISNLRHQASTLQTTIAERDTAARELEERATTADAATAAVQQELDALRVSISFPSASGPASDDPEALSKRITVLESDLRTAHGQLAAAAARAASLEQKIDALTKLHRDGTAAAQTKDRELADLRAQRRRDQRAPSSHVRDASDFELGDDDETETGALHARIRALEAETFDLRRGVWRDRRAELQPGMDEADHDRRDAAMPTYDDVSLLGGGTNSYNNGPYSPVGGRDRGILSRHHSTFQDVITSGINAFTSSRPREAGGGGGSGGGGGLGRERKASLGLLSEDGFDEEAYRLAQEEEGKRRVERVKEIKRGLDQWKGWRVDIAELRRAGVPGCGPVFAV